MTTILTKKKDTTGAPGAGDLTNSSGGAELAVNTFDKRLYTKDSSNNVVEVGTNPTELQIDNINVNGNTITSTNTDGNIDLTPNGTGEVNITKVDIDSGTIDNTTIGGATPAAGNFTTVNATNVEVTNIKAKDGTAAGSIADATGVVTFASTVLTTTDINGGSVDAVTLGTNSPVTEAQIDNVNINVNTISSTDTDGDLVLTPNGAGDLVLDGLNWPQADGTLNQALTTNGSGQLAWSTVAGSPGGSDTQIQYNSGGSFAGASGLVTDGSNLTLNAQGDVRFADSDSSNWVAFQAPATIASNVTWTLPDADGTDGQVIKTNGTGTLSWITPSAGGGGGGTSVTVTQATATAAQTDFSVTYTVGQLSVYLNGALLASGDFTASNGTTVVLAAGAAANDIFTAVAYDSATQITEGDSSVVVTDSGTGKVEVTVDNVEVADFTTGAIVFNETGANQDFRVEGDTNANLIVADAGVDKVGIGTNTFNTNGGVLQVSNGISFPATQSACADVNTLDDYEEGTFTPTLVGGSTSGTTTYNTQTGSYTKIGRQVTVTVDVDVSAMTGTGTLLIGNLPFTSASSFVAPLMVQNYDWSAGTYLQGFIFNGNSTVFIYALTDNAGWTSQSVVNEAQHWILTATYFTS